jgi:imidazolonepropionase
VALATDFNPGSSFCESLPLVMNLACTRLGLSPAEALCACTANAAHVLGLQDVGRLAPGYRADVLLLDAPDWRHVAYHLGGDRFAVKIKSGRIL